MNIQWQKGMMAAVFICLASTAASAATNNVQVLNDRELAGVRGGFCPFYTCETGAPSGVCQPHAPTQAGLCPQGTCTLHTEMLGRTEAVQCILVGKVTCTGNGGYRQCILGKLWSVCWSSSTNVCGVLAEPNCNYNLETHECDCIVVISNSTPCDWTNCLLESQ